MELTNVLDTLLPGDIVQIKYENLNNETVFSFSKTIFARFSPSRISCFMVFISCLSVGFKVRLFFMAYFKTVVTFEWFNRSLTNNRIEKSICLNTGLN